MTTKRLKKLMMSTGISRNQAARMIKEQHDTGSKKVSNAIYYLFVKKYLVEIMSSYGGEVLSHLTSFVLE